MASLRKLKGKWYVRFRYQGKEKIIPTYHTKKRDAEIVLRKYQQNEQEVKMNLSLHILDQNLSISDCVKYFIKNYPRESGITASTMKSYKYATGDFEKCFNHIRRFRELNSQHFPILVEYLKRHYSDTTVNIRLRGIRAFLNYLVEKEFIKSLPFNVKQLKMDKHPPKFLTPGELDKIYEQVEDPALLSIYKTLEVTGMRVGELRNSFRDGLFIRITKSKGRKERIIPIPVDYVGDYDRAKEIAYSESWITRSFTKIVKCCNIEGHKTVHSLRHTFAYRMLLEVNNIQLVRDLLGHSSVKVTEIYTRMPLDYLKQVFNDRRINHEPSGKVAANA